MYVRQGRREKLSVSKSWNILCPYHIPISLYPYIYIYPYIVSLKNLLKRIRIWDLCQFCYQVEQSVISPIDTVNYISQDK